MLNLKDLTQEDRPDMAFQLVVAMRDTLNIAKKKGHKATYENAIRIYHDFSPELYEDIVGCLPQRNLSDEAKVFVARAQALSSEQNKDVTPLELLDAEINEILELSRADGTSSDSAKTLRNKAGSLESLRASLTPRKISENRILIRDTSKADRTDFGAQFIRETDFYVDYKLSDEKYLRIRLLHPDKPEHITGADLIYEQHDNENGLIRFLFLQYKIWNNGVLKFSSAKNLEPQLKKLKSCLCDNGHCDTPGEINELFKFRFPFCAAFLRPTDKLQQQNEKLVSSGIHIPVCMVEKLKEIEGDRITRKNIRYQSLTHEIFENLFNRQFIGSRWMKEKEVETFYKSYGILEKNDTAILYAREIKDNNTIETFADLDT